MKKIIMTMLLVLNTSVLVANKFHDISLTPMKSFYMGIDEKTRAMQINEKLFNFEYKKLVGWIIGDRDSDKLYKNRDINAHGKMGDVPLITALKHQNVVFALEMLTLGQASLLMPNDKAETPLHIAIRFAIPYLIHFSQGAYSSMLVILKMIEKARNENFLDKLLCLQDCNGDTPLHVALQCFNNAEEQKQQMVFKQIIRMLTFFGAPLYVENKAGQTSYELLLADDALLELVVEQKDKGFVKK